MRKIAVLILILLMLIPKSAFALSENAKSACVMDALTGDIIYGKDAYTRRPMASTTKIMTAITALENSKIDDVVEISQNASMQEGSSAYLKAGSKMYMRDLLYGLMLNSGNDAAVAISEYVAGSTDKFVDMMNEKAWAIGAHDTSFVNPNGLPDDNHFTTARDLAWITRYAIRNSDFWNIVSASEMLSHTVDGETEQWYINHNKLLKMYDGCFGVKTGFTKTAGRCLVSAATRNNMTFIAVTLNDPNDWDDHIKMLDYAFSKYHEREIIAEGQTVKNAYIDGKVYPFVTAGNFTIPFREGQRLAIDVVNHLSDNIKAPINAGEKVGYMDISYGGEWIGTVDIISKENIYGISEMRLKNSFYNSFIKVLKLWCL